MKKEIEIQQENINTLIKLMKENPTLEVVPMVDTEVVASDDYSCWLGKFGRVEIDEIWSDDERIYFKSLDDEDLIDMTLEGMECDDKFNGLSNEELLKIAEKEVENLAWEKVIVVRIDTP
ncbi:MAG: hypothetical protein E7D27_14010 [Clostridium celatum]|nr:hypothetical protein [Clostridium celatum]